MDLRQIFPRGNLFWQKVSARSTKSTGKKGVPYDQEVDPFWHPSLQAAGPIRTTPPERLFTLPALRQAWLAVKRAGGGAGVDGVTLQRFGQRLEEELNQLQLELMEGAYEPRAVRRVLVPKANGGLRSLAMWALRDRIAQRMVYDIIAPTFEVTFLSCSYGFRPGRGVQDAINQVISYRDHNLRWVVDGDIQNCFDSIGSRPLMQAVRKRIHDRLLLRYIQGWLDAQIMNSVDGLPKQAGASQGSVLSPLLANVYLHQFDQMLKQQKLALVRYADDFVICCQRKAEAEAALQLAQQSLVRLDLTINPKKSRIVHFDQGFEWLGYFLIRRECHRLKN